MSNYKNRPKTLILGIGNTIRCDDGAGIEVVRRLTKKIKSENVVLKETSEAGFNLLDIIIGYERLIIVDSIQTKDRRIGDIYQFNLVDLKSSIHPQFSHQIDIPAVLSLGEKINLAVPKEITFFAIEIEKGDVFGQGLTKKVGEAVYRVVKLIMESSNYSSRYSS